jgi:dipeptidyl aminopeptidase/acylaminoacyl peptidase
MRKILVPLSMAIFSCLFVLPVLGAGDAPVLIPIHDLMQDPLIDDVKISPDGKSIAALYNNNDRIMILVKDLESEGAEPVVINVLNHNVKWVDWASNKRIIAGALVEGGLWNNYYALVVMDKDGKNMRHLISDFSIGNIIDLLPDDPDHVLVEELNMEHPYFPEVYKVSIGNERKEARIQESILNVDHWITDANGNVRMGIGYLPDRMIVGVKTARGEWRTIIDNNYLKTPLFNPLAIGKKGIAYVLSRHESDKAALYEYDIETQRFVRQLFKHEAVDIDDIYYSRLKDAVGYATFTYDATEPRFFDEEMNRDYLAAVRALPGKANIIADTSADEKRMIIYAGSSSNPGSFYLFDREKKTLKYLGSRYPGLENKTLSETKGTRYTARDGMTIYGYVSTPSGYEGTPAPMVVLVHGGPYTRDQNKYDPWVQFLTSRGYLVFQPNFRGSTGYGLAYWKNGYKQWGLAMEDDIIDGVKILIRDKVADPDRICIMGGSYGGYAALIGAARYPEVFRCAISIAGISDLNKLMTQKGNYLNRALIGDNAGDLKATSPVTYVKDIRIPVFLAHGTKDTNVPYSQSDDMYDALKKAKKDVTFLRLKDETHHLEDVKNRVALFEAIEKFLDRNMGVFSGAE